MVVTPWSPWAVAWKPGTSCTTSSMVCTWLSARVAALNAVIAIGVRCSEVERLVAVTMTSAMPLLSTARGAVAAGPAVVSAGRAMSGAVWAAALPMPATSASTAN